MLELAAERIYRRIVTHEVNNQTLPELKLCLQGYRDLVEEYPDTHFARVARGQIRRAEALVEVNQAIRADQAQNP